MYILISTYSDGRDEREGIASTEITPFLTFVTGNKNFRLSQYNGVQSDETKPMFWRNLSAGLNGVMGARSSVVR
jgi:hypothetical protein